MLQINVPDMNDSFLRVILEGETYLFRFTYNDRYDYWTFGVYITEEIPIMTGMKMLPCLPLNQYFRADRMPRGIFGVITEQEKVGRYSFVNDEAKFVFIPENEIPEEVPYNA